MTAASDRRARGGVPAVVALLLLPLLAACSPSTSAALPACTSVERLGLVAQSVPSSSYVVCLASLPAGWTSENTRIEDGRTAFHLVSDRAPDDPVRVELRAGCDYRGATPVPPRTPGGRTYLAVQRIAPRYAGTLYDVFPGGCVTYRFDFARGRHIGLMADLQAAVGFVSRQQLRRELRSELGVRLDP